MSFTLARAPFAARWTTPRLSSAAYATLTSGPAEVKSFIKTEHAVHISFGRDSAPSCEYRRLLRAVLREASYLPDPNARRFVEARAITISRKRAFAAWERRDDPRFAQRAAGQLADDRKWLSMLRRANQGERKALLQILLHTYGRTGVRRRELLKPLLPTVGREAVDALLAQGTRPAANATDAFQPFDAPGDVHIAAEDMSHAEGITRSDLPAASTRDQLPALTPELSALAKSQKQNQPPTLTRKNPRHLEPSIPATNTRGRPMPKKRVKNMHRQWYADLLRRILPPLPTKEWMQLHDWAQGKNPPRFEVPRCTSLLGPQPFLHFGKYSALEAIAMQGRIDKKVYENREAHQVTPRFMQRIWATIFATCPYMVHDASLNKWQVRWGHQELPRSMLAAVAEVADAGDLASLHEAQKPQELMD